MRQGELYIKTRKTLPKDEVAKNARLLIQAGFINKEMSGVYSYLPLGVRVLRKIEQIIREEMNELGGQEIFMTALQDPNVWKKSGRWDDNKIDTWFKTRNEEFGLGFTHEEPLVQLMTNHIHSYKDLPAYLYQFQTKFRRELRPKGGLLRGREFIMKDLYSFSKSEDDLGEFYEKSKVAYKKIFKRVGIGEKTYITFASGEPFSEFSHEFQTIDESGEDTIYLDRKSGLAINKEVYNDKILKELGLNKKDLTEERAIEVGNIFKLGTRFSEAFGLKYTDQAGKEHPVVMGCYGIGLGRLMATIVELLCDEGGIVWPESVAPFKVQLIELQKGQGEDIYTKLNDAGIETLYDDRDLSPGEKFNDADLIGIPWRLVVSKKSGNKVEIKGRAKEKVELITYEELIRKLS